MSGKFKTTSSSLYTKNNVRDDLPEWLEGISELELKPINKMDLDISPKGIFAEKNTVNRDNSSGELRYIHGTKLSLDRMVIDSKIQLANFLRGKYYKTEAAANGEEVQLLTKLDGVNGDFIFKFRKSGSKIANNNTFVININDEMVEYPFSKAGLEECIKDIKNNKITTSKKVESIGKASFFNKEEIIRRYNGSLRQATDKINELIKSGDIIGAGSNTFASYYDINYLFPTMEKEAIESPIGAFEFVPNSEHVATEEHKNEESFISDTHKIFNNIFSDYKLISLNRKNNSLYISAKILSNGITHEAGFNLNIDNEKINNINTVIYKDNKLTLDEFIKEINSNELARESDLNIKKMYNHQMYTKKSIHEKLAKLVNSSLVNDVIDSWINLKLIEPINSELFASKKSFPELLNNITIAKLSNDEIKNIVDYSKQWGIGLNKIGTQEKEKLSEEEIIFYSKKFGENLNFDRVEIEDTGVREIDNNITLDNLLIKCNQYIYKYIKEYSPINFEPRNNSADYTIEVFNKKANVNNTIKLILEYDDRKITGCYTEHNSEKVNIENIKNIFITDEEISNMKTYSKKFGEGLEINRYETENTGIREVEDNITSGNILAKCNQYISKYIKKYASINFEFFPEKDNVEYTIKMFNDELGLNNTVKLILGFDVKKIINCHTEHNGEKIGIEKIASVFVASELLKLHLANNLNKKSNANIIFSRDNLKQKLSKIASINENEMDNLIDIWENANKITKINSREFGSKYTFEELLNMSNIKPLSDEEIKEKFAKQQRNKLLTLKTGQYNIMDQENRQLIENCTPEKMLIHAKVELNKLFKEYDILDVNYEDNNYDVIAKFINPNDGLKQKLTFKFAIINNKPSEIIEIKNSKKTVKLAQIGELINNTSEIIQHYLKFNKVAEKQYSTIITKNQLINNLKQFENSPKIDDVVEMLVSYAIIKPLGNDKYGSLYSMTEVINNLEKMGLINKIDNTKLKTAQRENIIVNTTNKLTLDTDNRILEAKPKELSSKMIELKDKIKNTIDKALNNKIITSKKHFNLDNLLSEAKSERDLENIWKDFSNYIK